MAKGLEVRMAWFGERLLRPVVAYVVVVALGACVAYTVEISRQGRAVPGTLGDAVSGALLVFIVAAVLFLLPAFVMTLEIVDRLELTAKPARVVVGGTTWAGWYLFSAIALAVLSKVVLVVEPFIGGLVVIIAGGSLFSLVAIGRHRRRAGRVLTYLALSVVAVVVVGSFWMSGRWGVAV